jgi:macrolide transport system ATP-binding/permease protein
MGNLLRRIRYLFNRNRVEADLAEEMEFHRAMLARDLPGDSAAASRAWGNTTLSREDARAVWLLPWIESFGRILRMACAACCGSPASHWCRSPRWPSRLA